VDQTPFSQSFRDRATVAHSCAADRVLSQWIVFWWMASRYQSFNRRYSPMLRCIDVETALTLERRTCCRAFRVGSMADQTSWA
jgi:ferric iron reductase protein FhuF